MLIGAGALALVLAVVAVAGNRAPTAESTQAGAAPSSAAPTTGSDAVLGFLNAVAASDAERALAYVEEVPADRSLLTDAVLKASSELAPMTEISIPTSNQDPNRIDATFKLGGRTHTRPFNVIEVDGTWKVSDGVTDLDVSYRQEPTLPMIVNGVRVTASSLSLAPGTYAFTTGSRWVSWGTSNQTVVADEYPLISSKIEPTLTKAGSEAVVSKTKKAFNSCLAQHKLRPSGCPNRLSDTNGIKVKESTVRWRVTKDPFRNAKISLDSSDPTSAEGSFYPDYRIKFTGTKDGSTGTVDSDVIGLTSFETVADLSKAEVTVKIG